MVRAAALAIFTGSVGAITAVPAMAQPSRDDGPIQIWFAGSQEDVGARLANLCIDRNALVIEQSSHHVLCSRATSGFDGALARVIVGNTYSTQPELKFRFSLVQDRGSVRVQAVQWLETQMAFGQVRRSELDGRRHRSDFRRVLIDAGGSPTRPDVADHPADTGNEAPQKP